VTNRQCDTTVVRVVPPRGPSPESPPGDGKTVLGRGTATLKCTTHVPASRVILRSHSRIECDSDGDVVMEFSSRRSESAHPAAPETIGLELWPFVGVDTYLKLSREKRQKATDEAREIILQRGRVLTGTVSRGQEGGWSRACVGLWPVTPTHPKHYIHNTLDALDQR